jgi:hypothetical protein
MTKTIILGLGISIIQCQPVPEIHPLIDETYTPPPYQEITGARSDDPAILIIPCEPDFTPSDTTTLLDVITKPGK